MVTFLLILIIPITLLNFYLIARSNSRRKVSRKNYRHLLEKLTEKAFNDLGLSRKETLEIYPYISDDNDNYILAVHKKKNIMAIVTDEDCWRMSIDSRKKCTVEIERGERPGTVSCVKCLVDAPEFDENIIVFFSKRPHREKEFVYRFILENANEFKARIEGRA
ncbi:MAG: hypothetical protein IJ831_00395 [Spirochaetales bacterium]|nr:hypothetical protein [Spirochaetales bacterium]